MSAYEAEVIPAGNRAASQAYRVWVEALVIVGMAILGAALLGTIGLLAIAMLRMDKIGRPKGHRTSSERFADDAEKLHRLVHPEEKEPPQR